MEYRHTFKNHLLLAVAALVAVMLVFVSLDRRPASATGSCVANPGGMVGWYAGDRVLALTDSSSTANNAFFVNRLTQGFTDGRYATSTVGEGFYFDGFKDVLLISNVAALQMGTGPMTVDAWIRFKGTVAGGAIATIYENHGSSVPRVRLYLDENEKPAFNFRDADGDEVTATGATALNDGRFHHVAGVRSGGVANLYVDGQLVASEVNSLAAGSITSTCDYARSGASNTQFNPNFVDFHCAAGAPGSGQGSLRHLPTGHYFKGNIDELHIFNTALTEANIQSIFNAAQKGVCGKTLGVSTRNLGAIRQSESNSFSIEGMGGTAPYTFSLTSGSLPTGLSLSSAGLISGTPTATGTSQFVVTATDGVSGTSSWRFTQNVVNLSTSIANNLVFWYTFENTSGDLVFDAGREHTARRIDNAPLASDVGQSGKTGNGLAPNLGGGAANGAMLVSRTDDIEPGRSSFTIAAWFKSTTVTSLQTIFQDYECGIACPTGANGLYALYISNSKLAAQIRDTGGTSQDVVGTTNVIDSTFHHVAFVRDVESGTASIYLDGELEVSNTLTVTGPIENDDGEDDPLTIGGGYSGGSSSISTAQSFRGVIDDAMYFSKAITQCQVREIAGITTTPCEPIAASAQGGGSAFSFPVSSPSVVNLLGLIARWSGDGEGADYINRSSVLSNSDDAEDFQFLLTGGQRISEFRRLVGNGVVLTPLINPFAKRSPQPTVTTAALPPDPITKLERGAQYVKGYIGNAISFDGVDDLAISPVSTDWNLDRNDFTIQMWANFASVRPGPADKLPNVFLTPDVATTPNDWNFFLADDGLQFFTRESSNHPSTFVGKVPFTPVLGRWHHIAVTRSGTTFNFYVDGVLRGSAQSSINIYAYRSRMYIGARPGGGHFHGMLDQIEIFNRALTSDEIKRGASLLEGGIVRTPVTLTNPVLPESPAEEVFSSQIQVSGGLGPYAFRSLGGLPSGTELSQSGVLSGTIPQDGVYRFQIQVTDARSDVSEVMTITKGVSKKYFCTAPPDGLVSWWRGEGNGNDYANANPANVSGVSFATGRVGQGFSFDSKRLVVAVADSPSIRMTGPFSVSAWIRSGTNRAAVIFEKLNMFGLSTDGRGGLDYGHGAHATATPVYDSNFHHVVFTYLPGVTPTSKVTQILYIDGKEVARTVRPDTVGSATSLLTLGGRADGSKLWLGVLDELSIWNKVLTPNEVQSVFASQSAGVCRSFAITTGAITALVGGDFPRTLGFIGASRASFRIVSGQLPPGVVLVPDGTLRGVPEKAGTYTVVVEAVADDATSASLTSRLFSRIGRIFGLTSANASVASRKTIVFKVELAGVPVVDLDFDGPVNLAQCAAVPDNLAGWWKGESSGRNEIWPGSTAAISPSDVGFASGVVGDAFVPLNSKEIDFKNASDLQISQGDFAGDFWVRFSSLEGQQSIVLKSRGVDGWGIQKNSVNQIELCPGGAAQCAVDPQQPGLKVNTWYFIRFGISKTGIDDAGNTASNYYLRVLERGAQWRTESDPFKSLIGSAPFEIQDSNTTSLTISSSKYPLVGFIDELHLYAFGEQIDATVFGKSLETTFGSIFEAGSAGVCTQVDPIVYTKKFPPSSLGAPFADQLKVLGSDDAYSFEISNVPSGVTVDKNTGVVSGQAPENPFTILAQATTEGPRSCTVQSDAQPVFKEIAKCTVPPQGLIHWWRGENAMGDHSLVDHMNPRAAEYNIYIKDSSIRGNFAGPGRVGQGFHFGGDHSWKIPEAILPPDVYTISFWIRPLNTAGTELFAFLRNISTDAIAGANLTKDGALKLGTWYQFTQTSDGMDIQYYINGVRVGKSTVKDDGMLGSQFFGENGEQFDIDEIQMYNRALTPPDNESRTTSEVSDIYNANTSGLCTFYGFRTPVVPATLPGMAFSHEIKTFNSSGPAKFERSGGTCPDTWKVSEEGEFYGKADGAVGSLPVSCTVRVRATLRVGNILARDRESKDKNDPLYLEFTKKIADPSDAILPPDGMIAWYPGEQSSDDIVVLGGEGEAKVSKSPATFLGSYEQVGDTVRPALSKKGYSFRVRPGSNIDFGHPSHLNIFNEDFGVDAWVRFDNAIGDQVILGKMRTDGTKPIAGWWLLKNDNGTLTADFRGNSNVTIFTESALRQGRWYHIALTVTHEKDETGKPVGPAIAEIFVDGFSRVRGLVETLTDDPAVSLVAGSGPNGIFPMDGHLDEIEIFGTGGIKRTGTRAQHYRSSNDFAEQPKDVMIGIAKADAAGKDTSMELSLGEPITTQQYVYACDAAPEVFGVSEPLYYETDPSVDPVPGMSINHETGDLCGKPTDIATYQYDLIISEGEYASVQAVRPTFFARVLRMFGITSATAADSGAGTVKKKTGGKSAKVKMKRSVAETRTATSGVRQPDSMVAWLSGNDRNAEEATNSAGGEGGEFVGGAPNYLPRIAPVAGAPQAPTAKKGSSFFLGKSKKYIEFPGGAESNIAGLLDLNLSSFGFDTWVAFDATDCAGVACDMVIASHGDPRKVASKGSGFQVHKTKTNALEACVGVESQDDKKPSYQCLTTGDNRVKKGVWYHVAASVWKEGDVPRLAFYVRGKPVQDPVTHKDFSIIPKMNVKNDDLPLAFGNDAAGTSEGHLEGILDEIELFSLALSSSKGEHINDPLPADLVAQIFKADSAVKVEFAPEILNASLMARPMGEPDAVPEPTPDVDVKLPSAVEGASLSYSLYKSAGYGITPMEFTDPGISGIVITKEGEIRLKDAAAGTYGFDIDLLELPDPDSDGLVLLGEKAKIRITITVEEKGKNSSCVAPPETMLVWMRGEDKDKKYSLEDWIIHKDPERNPDNKPNSYASSNEFVPNPTSGEGISGKGFDFGSGKRGIEIENGVFEPGAFVPDPNHFYFKPAFGIPMGIDAWVKFRDISGEQVIFHAMSPGTIAPGWRMYKDSDNYLKLCWNTGSGGTEAVEGEPSLQTEDDAHCISTKTNAEAAETKTKIKTWYPITLPLVTAARGNFLRKNRIAQVEANTWYHVAATMAKNGAGVEFTFYVNGLPVFVSKKLSASGAYKTSVTDPNGPNSLSRNLYIGTSDMPLEQPRNNPFVADPSKVTQGFKGIMDEIEIFRPTKSGEIPLSAEAISKINAAEGVGKCSGVLIKTESVPDGNYGDAYADGTTVVLEAYNGLPNYEWSFLDPDGEFEQTVPGWLKLDKDGTLRGTPDETGEVKFRAYVKDQRGSVAYRDYTFSVGDTNKKERVKLVSSPNAHEYRVYVKDTQLGFEIPGYYYQGHGNELWDRVESYATALCRYENKNVSATVWSDGKKFETSDRNFYLQDLGDRLYFNQPKTGCPESITRSDLDTEGGSLNTGKGDPNQAERTMLAKMGCNERNVLGCPLVKQEQFTQDGLNVAD